MAIRRRIDPAEGRAQLQLWFAARHHDATGCSPDRVTLAAAVRFTLEELASRVEGNSVEVRVPPFGVTQCAPGPRHTRGTPPNVVEVQPEAWLRMVTGLTSFDEAAAAGELTASGTRADISTHLPLFTATELIER